MGRKDAADGGVQELLQANPLVDWAVFDLHIQQPRRIGKK